MCKQIQCTTTRSKPFNTDSLEDYKMTMAKDDDTAPGSVQLISVDLIGMPEPVKQHKYETPKGLLFSAFAWGMAVMAILTQVLQHWIK